MIVAQVRLICSLSYFLLPTSYFLQVRVICSLSLDRDNREALAASGTISQLIRLMKGGSEAAQSMSTILQELTQCMHSPMRMHSPLCMHSMHWLRGGCIVCGAGPPRR